MRHCDECKEVCAKGLARNGQSRFIRGTCRMPVASKRFSSSATIAGRGQARPHMARGILGPPSCAASADIPKPSKIGGRATCRVFAVAGRDGQFRVMTPLITSGRPALCRMQNRRPYIFRAYGCIDQASNTVGAPGEIPPAWACGANWPAVTAYSTPCSLLECLSNN